MLANMCWRTDLQQGSKLVPTKEGNSNSIGIESYEHPKVPAPLFPISHIQRLKLVFILDQPASSLYIHHTALLSQYICLNQLASVHTCIEGDRQWKVTGNGR